MTDLLRNRRTPAVHDLEIAGLKTHFVPARDGSTRGPDSILVLLHGHGAAGDDLVYLSEALALPAGTALVFPEGPLDLGQPPGCNRPARGWWPTDSRQFHLAMFTGQCSRASSAAGLQRHLVRPLFSAFVQELQAKFELNPHRIVLGGFSQGAILCLDWVLHNGECWAGLLCLSGTLVEGSDWDTCLASRDPLRVMISHGRYDPILPFSLAYELRSRLERASWDVDFVSFDGSHAIAQEVTRAISGAAMRWLGESAENQSALVGESSVGTATSHQPLESHRT